MENDVVAGNDGIENDGGEDRREKELTASGMAKESNRSDGEGDGGVIENASIGSTGECDMGDSDVGRVCSASSRVEAVFSGASICGAADGAGET
jgi:hypothetical protein